MLMLIMKKPVFWLMQVKDKHMYKVTNYYNAWQFNFKILENRNKQIMLGLCSYSYMQPMQKFYGNITEQNMLH